MARKSVLFFLFLSTVQGVIGSLPRIPSAPTIDYVEALVLFMFRHAPENFDQVVILREDEKAAFRFGRGLFCANAHKAEDEFGDFPEIQLFLNHFASKHQDKLVWEYSLNDIVNMRLERSLTKGISALFYDHQTKVNYTVQTVKKICNGDLRIKEWNPKANR